MLKHTGIFFITSFFVWMAIYSIPSAPVVFEASPVIAASRGDVVYKLAEIRSELESVSLKVRDLNESEENDHASLASDDVKPNKVREVPFYSQFDDITPAEWKKIGCGIANLAMLVDYYEPAVSVDVLLQEGISSGAYISSAGWSHWGLIKVAENYGLTGEPVGLSHLSPAAAFIELEQALKEGPVMASVYYTFTPGHPIPHLVVINDVKDGLVYYNDPAEPNGGGTISIEKFKPAWKQRYISIRPIS